MGTWGSMVERAPQGDSTPRDLHGVRPQRTGAAAATARTASITTPAPAAHGVRVSLSDAGLAHIGQTASNAAHAAQGAVLAASHVAQDALGAVDTLVDVLADRAGQALAAVADGVQATAEVLTDGVEAVRTGTRAVTDTLSRGIEGAAEPIGEAVQAVVGYGVMAGLAGAHLLDEIA